MSEQAAVAPEAAPRRRRIPLYLRVIAGVAVGASLGVVFRSRPWLFGLSNDDLGPIGMLVIRLLKTLATPLILFAVIDAFLKTAIRASSGLRLLAICAVNVTIAMLIGLTLLGAWRPGERWAGHLAEMGLALHVGPAAASAAAGPAPSLDPLRNLAGFVPENVIDPLERNAVIPVVLLAVLAGAALRRAREAGTHVEAVATVERFAEAGYAALATMIGWVADAVPFAVLLVVAQVVGHAGLEIFRVLGTFLAAMLAGLLAHALIYYPLAAWLVARTSPVRWFRAGADAVFTGLSCNSSLATMPLTLKSLKKLGVSDSSARLSACVGTNFNNDGIMLYEAMAAIFLCQALGWHLSIGQQVTVALSAIMVGVGIAGIPDAGLIILPLVLSAAGLPEAVVAAAIPLIVPVDWIIARVRSGVNVMADMLVAMLLDRFEPQGPAPASTATAPAAD